MRFSLLAANQTKTGCLPNGRVGTLIAQPRRADAQAQMLAEEFFDDGNQKEQLLKRAIQELKFCFTCLSETAPFATDRLCGAHATLQHLERRHQARHLHRIPHQSWDACVRSQSFIRSQRFVRDASAITLEAGLGKHRRQRSAIR